MKCTASAFGVKHDVAIVGWGNFDGAHGRGYQEVVRDRTQALVGGVPYDYYLFVIHCFPDAGGGLEHLIPAFAAGRA